MDAFMVTVIGQCLSVSPAKLSDKNFNLTVSDNSFISNIIS